MCRSALLLACFLGVVAVGCAADAPLEWVKDGQVRDSVVNSAEDKVAETPSKMVEFGAGEVQAREFSEDTPLSAAEVLKRMYVECVQRGSFACVKPKALAFLSAAMKKENIPITDNLAIRRTNKHFYMNNFKWDSANPVQAEEFLEKVEDFLASHELKLRMPKEILSGEMLYLVPKFLLKNLPAELTVPLTENTNVGQERGFIKKIVIPFLLGLKLKASALLPLALTLVALKTWKALTLGLLSLVLSGALVIFKFTKPKVVNYEVVHYPHHPPPVIHQPVEHHGWEHQSYSGRAADAQDLAFRGYQH